MEEKTFYIHCKGGRERRRRERRNESVHTCVVLVIGFNLIRRLFS